MRSPPPVGTALPTALFALAAVTAAAVIAPAAGPAPGPRTLHLDARCLIVDADAIEALGDLEDELVRLAHARCVAEGGPLAGAVLDAEWTWAVERRASGSAATVWRAPGATLMLPPLDATLRRAADGAWIVGARGTVADASGRAAGWTGRPYVLSARLEGVDAFDVTGH
ncbi:MAG: hypothetical protein WCK28_12070 [Burkholderiales bacterium]